MTATRPPPSHPPADHRMLTIAQAAERLSVSPRTIRRLIGAGRLPAARIGVGGRLVRIHPHDVRMLERPL